MAWIACAGNTALPTLNPLSADPLKWNLGAAWTPAQLQPHGITLFLILHDSRQIYWGLCVEGNVLPEETVLALAPAFSCALSCHSCKAAFGRHAAKTLHKHVSWTVEFLSLLLTPSCCCSGLNFPESLCCLKTDYCWCRRNYVFIGVRRWQDMWRTVGGRASFGWRTEEGVISCAENLGGLLIFYTMKIFS